MRNLVGRPMSLKSKHPRGEAEECFRRACQLLDQGRPKQAFRLFHTAASLGHASSQLDLGVLYDEGRGVKPSKARAMYWYRRALKNGSPSAAHNIGTLYRDSGRDNLALRWFRRSLKNGDDDALLEIAKVHLKKPNGARIRSARKQLAMAAESKNITPASRDEARRLLKTLKRSSSSGD